jgi:hypothetical protein
MTFFLFCLHFSDIEQFSTRTVLINIEYLNKNNYETEKSFSRYRYCHFHYIIIVLVIGSRGYETLVVGYGSFRGTTILCLILTGFG